jgi:hypothetical protein
MVVTKSANGGLAYEILQGDDEFFPYRPFGGASLSVSTKGLREGIPPDSTSSKTGAV